MRFSTGGTGGNCFSCEWSYGEGIITPDTPRVFEEFLASSGVGHVLYLNSTGGSLAAGLELGRMFRQEGIAVAIGFRESRDDELSSDQVRATNARCLSACAYAFLGGERRSLSSEASLGFHQFADEPLDAETVTISGLDQLVRSAREQYNTGLIVDYILEMGISADLYPLAAEAPPDEFRYISDVEAINLNIDNSEDAAEKWNAVPFGDRGLIAEMQTSRTGRQFRLYCAGQGQHHLTVLLPTGTWSDVEDLGRRYERMGKYLTIHTQDASVDVTIDDVVSMSQTGRTVVVTKVSPEGARKLAAAELFDVRTEDHFTRADEAAFYDVFEVPRIAGQQDVARAVLRLCI
ncbi:hypothetical protein D8780_15660 [Notoacmeibacter ruber]|uniref:Uncharacterized protein n=2 Tax=Notoacmeibacter ruber TaxID=2670375 RepID=A0A3L7J2V0_9HYPH|nr:hypothetical protein D8780_15660 [Notoacmeibacter ruber]